MIKGLDVSHYQNEKGKIDWVKVRAAGYDFTYIKASEGLTIRDAFYRSNIEAARKAGLVVGSYHFARANDAVREADYFLATVGSLQDFDFLVLDWEIEFSDPDGWCRAFLDRCFEKTGVRPLLYTNGDRVARIDWKKVVAGSYGLIAAKYGDNDAVLEDNEIASADEFPFVVIQQFTSNMTVPGITGRVDANVGNLTVDTLKKYGKQPVEVPLPTCEPEPIGSDLARLIERCGATANEKKSVGENFDGEKDGGRISAIVNRKLDALELEIKRLSALPAQTTIPVEPELVEAVEYAHDILIGDGFTPEKQRLVATREIELKKSEMFSRETLSKVKEIVNQ